MRDDDDTTRHGCVRRTPTRGFVRMSSRCFWGSFRGVWEGFRPNVIEVVVRMSSTCFGEVFEVSGRVFVRMSSRLSSECPRGRCAAVVRMSSRCFWHLLAGLPGVWAGFVRMSSRCFGRLHANVVVRVSSAMLGDADCAAREFRDERHRRVLGHTSQVSWETLP